MSRLGPLATLALAVGLLAGAAGPASAHKFQVKRALFLEPAGARELQVIVVLKVPSGTARQALEVVADRDHDGRLSAAEVRGLEGLLTSRALEGLSLWVGTATLAVSRPEVKLKSDPGGPLELMLHGVAQLPDAGPAARSGAGLTLAVSTGTLGDPLDLLVLAGTRPARDPSRGQLRQGSLKVALGLGDRVSWHIE